MHWSHLGQDTRETELEGEDLLPCCLRLRGKEPANLKECKRQKPHSSPGLKHSPPLLFLPWDPAPSITALGKPRPCGGPPLANGSSFIKLPLPRLLRARCQSDKEAHACPV